MAENGRVGQHLVLFSLLKGIPAKLQTQTHTLKNWIISSFSFSFSCLRWNLRFFSGTPCSFYPHRGGCFPSPVSLNLCDNALLRAPEIELLAGANELSFKCMWAICCVIAASFNFLFIRGRVDTKNNREINQSTSQPPILHEHQFPPLNKQANRRGKKDTHENGFVQVKCRDE